MYGSENIQYMYSIYSSCFACSFTVLVYTIFGSVLLVTLIYVSLNNIAGYIYFEIISEKKHIPLKRIYAQLKTHVER